jgi:voltage-gated potassium channel
MSTQQFTQKNNVKIQNKEPFFPKPFEIGVQVLVVFSIVILSLETLPNLSTRETALLNMANMTVMLLFTVEYGVRFYLAPKKRSFVFSFYGMIDLLAIIPFYMSFGLVDGRALRLFRLLRLIRLFKLARYNKALQRFQKAILLAKEELILFSGASLVFVFFAALGIYHFEHNAQPQNFQSIFDSLWWAVITLTTVGYGDIYPITVGGRIFTFFLLVVGLGIIAVPPGLIAAAMTQASLEDKS